MSKHLNRVNFIQKHLKHTKLGDSITKDVENACSSSRYFSSSKERKEHQDKVLRKYNKNDSFMLIQETSLSESSSVSFIGVDKPRSKS
jgi:hypothetical protein